MKASTVAIWIGALLLALAPVIALAVVYGDVLPRLRAADLQRERMRQQIANTFVKSQSSCAAIRDVESALGDFASSWLPPDQDYLRVHQHENSETARFHANRVFGLTRLQGRMDAAQKRACLDVGSMPPAP